MISTKTKTTHLSFIIIITLLSGLIAGLISLYQMNQNSKKITVDIISTITPREQDSNAAISVPVDPMQFNQTLTIVLNQSNATKGAETISCQADLNSTIIHCDIIFLTKEFDRDSFTTAFIKKIRQKSQELAINQYNNKLEPQINLLFSSQPSFPSFPSNPYLITVLGLLVGYFVARVLTGKNLIQPAER